MLSCHTKHRMLATPFNTVLRFGRKPLPTSAEMSAAIAAPSTCKPAGEKVTLRTARTATSKQAVKGKTNVARLAR